MSDTEAIVDNIFDIIVPDPGEPLRAVIIHPRNAELQSRKNTHLEFKLPARIVRDLTKRLKRLKLQLKDGNYEVIKTLIDDARNRYEQIVIRRKAILDLRAQGEDVSDLLSEWRTLKAEFISLKQRVPALMAQQKALVPIARRAEQIERRLEQHRSAVARDEAYRRVRRGLQAEAEAWYEIVSDALTGMGRCFRYSRRGREITRRVRFSEVHVGLDAVWLKVLGTQKTLFGWKWMLPRNLNPKDLITEDTLLGLTIACERQVEAINHKHSGVWYRINRLGVTDGIVERVTYGQIMATYPHDLHTSVPIPLGVKPGLEVFWAALSEYPHLLIAGASGSGKSNTIKNLISTIIVHQEPKEVRLILVDLKEGTEFAIYEDMQTPHLVGSVIKTAPEFANVLAQLEMLRILRSEKLRSVYATNLDDYNARVPEAERMPRIVVIIDEFSAIYMSNPFQSQSDNLRIANQIKALIRQHLAKARAVGIQIVISTQSPYVEILPGIDKANISLKVCGRFIDKATSRAILGVGAAADIPEGIAGRMIVQTSGQMFMIQTPFVSDDDRQNAIDASKLHPDTWPVELPPLPESEDRAVQFTKEELVEVSLNEFGGKLSINLLWRDYVKHTGRISHDGLTQLIRAVAEQKVITHEGVTYQVEKGLGGGSVLKAVNHDTVTVEHEPENVTESQ